MFNNDIIACTLPNILSNRILGDKTTTGVATTNTQTLIIRIILLFAKKKDPDLVLIILSK